MTKYYDSVEELIEAESNGFVVSILLETKGGKVFVNSIGPFDSQRRANNQARRLRRQFKKDQAWQENVLRSIQVRPLWQPEVFER